MPVDRITAFNGGINERTTLHLVPNHQAVEALNVAADSLTLKPVRGVKFSSQPGFEFTVDGEHPEGYYPYSASMSSPNFYWDGYWWKIPNVRQFLKYGQRLFLLDDTEGKLKEFSYELSIDLLTAYVTLKDAGLEEPESAPVAEVVPADVSQYGNIYGYYVVYVNVLQEGGVNYAPKISQNTQIQGMSSGSTATVVSAQLKSGTEYVLYLKNCNGWDRQESVLLNAVDSTQSSDPNAEVAAKVWSMPRKPERNLFVMDGAIAELKVGHWIQSGGDEQFYRVKSVYNYQGGNSHAQIPNFHGLQLETVHSGLGDTGVWQGGPLLWLPGGQSVAPYEYRIGVVHQDGRWSVASEASAAVQLYSTLQHVKLTGAPQNHSELSHLTIYRRGGTSSLYKLVEMVEVAGSVPVDWEYHDTKRDSELGDVLDEDLSPPPSGLQHLIELNNVFFAAKDNRLYISVWGKPNAWPVEGYTDFDDTITGLGRFGGGVLVFTPHQSHLVYANDPYNVATSTIIGSHGVPAGWHGSIANAGTALFFLSRDGLCAYDGQQIQVISQFALESMEPPQNAISLVRKGVYYLLGSAGTGYLVRFAGQAAPAFFQTSLVVNMLYYHLSQDQVYTEVGKLNQGLNVPFTYKTGGLTGGDYQVWKRFEFYRVTWRSSANTALQIRVYLDTGAGQIALLHTHTLEDSGGEIQHQEVVLPLNSEGFLAQFSISGLYLTDPQADWEAEIYGIDLYSKTLQ